MNVEVWVHDRWLSEPLSSLMAVSVAGAKSLKNVWEWVCDALLRCDVFLVPLSVWCSSARRAHLLRTDIEVSLRFKEADIS